MNRDLTPRERAIAAINNSVSELSDIETILLKWQYRMYGDFYTALFDAITRADDTNCEKLALGFPREVMAFRLWQTTWIAESLRVRGLLD